MRRPSGRRGGLGRGASGRGNGAAHCGTESGSLGINGLPACVYFAFTHSHARPPPPSHPPPGPLPRWRTSSGAGQGPESDARDMREQLGNVPTEEPRRSRPGPQNKLQAIALPPLSLRVCAKGPPAIQRQIRAGSARPGRGPSPPAAGPPRTARPGPPAQNRQTAARG